MEIAISMMGIAITVLVLVFAYIWKSNGKLQMNMMAALERIEVGQQKGFEQIEKGQQKGFKQMREGFEQMGERQEIGSKILAEMLIKQTEMITSQTKILEKIEVKL